MRPRILLPLLLTVLSVAGCDNSDSGTSYGRNPGGPVGQVEEQGPAVPAALTGRWNGGSNETGHWYYEFDSVGHYRAWPSYADNPEVITGTVIVRPGTITFSNNGSPVTSRWSISGGLLYLDGFSYVRA
jgi:hypothetical protein